MDILYTRETEKLFNRNTAEEEGVKVEKTIQEQKQKKGVGYVKCPYFRSPNKICAKMAEKGLDARVSDFDVQHFCNGDPINCFFFRLSPSKKEDEPKAISWKHRFFNMRIKPRKVQE